MRRGFAIVASCILALCTAFTTVGMNIHAEGIQENWGDVYFEDDFEYLLEGDSISILNYTGTDAEVTVPMMIAGATVNCIQTGALVDKSIKKVYIPSSAMDKVMEGAINPDAIIVLGYDLATPVIISPSPKEEEETKESEGFGNIENSKPIAAGTKSPVLVQGSETWFQFTAGNETGYKFSDFIGTIKIYDENLDPVEVDLKAFWTIPGKTYYISAQAQGVNQTFTISPMIYYDVHFDPNGGTGTMENQSFIEDEEKTLSANAFTRVGYEFEEWNTSPDGSGEGYQDGESVVNLSSVKGQTVNLYAQWKKITYKITYTLNGGKLSSAAKKSYTVTTSTFTLKNPTRTGYTFSGWYKSSKFTGSKVASVKKGTTGDIKLYAKWTANKYTIKFDAYGGKGKMSSLTKRVYGKTYKLTANKFTKKGYVFKGWATSKTNAKKCKIKYKNKASVKNLSSKNGAAVILYAAWKKK